MSTLPAIDPIQQPPPFSPLTENHANTHHSVHGSVGPVIGVLATVMVLGAVAVVIGRLCSGRRVMGHVQYDFEGWIETKCSTCIDGRPDPPPRRETVPVVVVLSSDAAAVEAMDTPENLVQPQGDGGSNHQQKEEQGNVDVKLHDG